MRPKVLVAGLVLSLSAVAAAAQSKPQTLPSGMLYCSGIVTTESVPRDTYVITGQQSNYRLGFDEGKYVYINKGSSEGVKVGDEFMVVRPVVDTDPVDWTKWQSAILHKMGTMWEDESRLKVVVAEANVAIAQVEHACQYVQRGDIVLPLAERPSPALKSEVNFDQFAPPNGKPLAMVIVGKSFLQQLGRNNVMYVNLGSSQGVRVGDYFRIFRYEGTETELAYQTPRFAFDVYGDLGPTVGFGQSPKKWNWSNVPREDIGEGVVLRTGPNSSTVLITFSLIEIYPGDFVELE
jgi:hypothetical protein